MFRFVPGLRSARSHISQVCRLNRHMSAAPPLNPERKRINMVMVGPPGSGKGTQSERIRDNFGPIPFSSGNLLRAEIALKTPAGLEAERQIKQGKLVQDDIVFQIVTNQLKVQQVDFGWILDGFPRTVEQAKMLDEFLRDNGGRGVDLVLNLHASLQEVEMRLCGRLVHLPSGRSYHNVFNPPKVPEKDDVTGEPLTQRDDDKPETVRSRMATYLAVTAPVLEYYNKLGRVRRVVVDGGTPKSVFAMVKPIMEETVAQLPS